MHLPNSNTGYYGIAIFIERPAPNLIEIDFFKEPIGFEGRQFDIIMA
jgi:hypothetical protein